MRTTCLLLVLAVAPACTYDGSVALTLPPLEPGHLEARWAVTLGGTFTTGERVVASSDGDVFVAGLASEPEGAVTLGAFVAKRAGSDGAPQWSALLEQQTVAGLAATDDGGVVIATIRWDPTRGARGSSALARYDASGAVLWARDLAGWNDVGITQLWARGDTIHIAGTYRDTIDVGTGLVVNPEPESPQDIYLAETGDAFVARLDANGTLLSGETFAAPGGQIIRELAVADDGDVVFTAYSTAGSATFGGVTVGPSPYHGIALVRTSATGQLRWAMELPPLHGGHTATSALGIDATGRIIVPGFETAATASYVTTRIIEEGAPVQTHETSLAPDTYMGLRSMSPDGMILAFGESSAGKDVGVFDTQAQLRARSSFSTQGEPTVPQHALMFFDVAIADRTALVAGQLSDIADFGTGPVRSHHARTYPDGSPMSSGGDGLVVAFDWVPD